MPPGTEFGQDFELMVRVAEMYYPPEGWGAKRRPKKKEIVERLHKDGIKISASTVQRLLERAESMGLVRITLDVSHMQELSARLQMKFGLKNAVVIPSGEADQLKIHLGTSAAKYFEQIAKHGIRVGLTFGETLYHCVHGLTPGRFQNLKIYPMAADTRLMIDDPNPNSLVATMKAKYPVNAKAYVLHAELMGRWKDIYDRLTEVTEQADWSAATATIVGKARAIENTLRDQLPLMIEAQRVLDDAKTVNVVLMGIGSVLVDTSPGFSEHVKRFKLGAEQLRSIGAVGQVNYQLFDRDGSQVDAPELRQLNDSIVAVPLSSFREMVRSGATVVAVAGGLGKKEAIEVCLRTKLFNALVTDADVARWLLSSN